MRKDPSLLNLEFDHSSSRNGFKNPKIIFRPLEDEKLPLSAFQDISTTHAEPAPKIRIPMVPETPAETVTASPKETSLKIDPTPPAAWDNKPRLKFEVPFASPSIAEPVERPLPEPLKPTSMIPEETTEEFVQEEVLPLEESIDEPRPWPKLKFPHFKLPSLKLPQVAWPKLEPLNLKPLADFISLPSFTWTMFSSQVLLSMLIPVPKTDALHVGAFAAGTWVFLFGVILLDGLALKITLEAGDALRIMGQASIPLVLRSFLRLLGAFIPSLASLRALAVSNPLPITSFWVRPLDIFEIAALAVFGYALHRQPGSTFKKCLIAAASVALAAALADRGYFSPF
jgi:hypothetical protein